MRQVGQSSNQDFVTSLTINCAEFFMNGFHLEVLIDCQHEEYCFRALSPSYQIENVGSVRASFITNFVEEKECSENILVWVWPCFSLCNIWYKISVPVLLLLFLMRSALIIAGTIQLWIPEIYIYSDPTPPRLADSSKHRAPAPARKTQKLEMVSCYIPGFHPSHVMVICLSSKLNVKGWWSLCVSQPLD